jgi:hypothetical protein
MIFLIEYNRKQGLIVQIQKFEDNQKELAQDQRLELELKLNSIGRDHEIVLLDADSEAALRRTHRRYFESLSELAVLPV